jgi:hypothetical protein
MLEKRDNDYMFSKQITDIMMSMTLRANQRCLCNMQMNCATTYSQEKQNSLSFVCH